MRLAHETLTLQLHGITWNRFSPVEIEAVDRALTAGESAGEEVDRG